MRHVWRTVVDEFVPNDEAYDGIYDWLQSPPLRVPTIRVEAFGVAGLVLGLLALASAFGIAAPPPPLLPF